MPRFLPRVWDGGGGWGETKEVSVEVPDLRESVRPAEVPAQATVREAANRPLCFVFAREGV